MPKFLFAGSYTADGMRGVIKGRAAGRKVAVEKMLASLGGTLEGLYFTFGKDDVIVLADLPDSVSAAALSVAVAASGALKGKTTPLLTVEELDQALAKTVTYTPPGG
jgi:uncharacterized protein with GYD domain